MEIRAIFALVTSAKWEEHTRRFAHETATSPLELLALALALATFRLREAGLMVCKLISIIVKIVAIVEKAILRVVFFEDVALKLSVKIIDGIGGNRLLLRLWCSRLRGSGRSMNELASIAISASL